MDFSIKNGLALLAIVLACARSCEQLLPLIRRRRYALAPADSPQVSLLSPCAGAAALAYGHAIGADSALLIATWTHTAAAVTALLITSLGFQRGQEKAEMTAQEINHA